MNGTTVPPAAPVTSASFTIGVPVTPGTYEFRLHPNNGFGIAATSGLVTVTASTAQLTVNGIAPPTPVSVGPAAAVQLSVTDGPGATGDWVGLYAAGAADSAFLAWQYLAGLMPCFFPDRRSLRRHLLLAHARMKIREIDHEAHVREHALHRCPSVVHLLLLKLRHAGAMKLFEERSQIVVECGSAEEDVVQLLGEHRPEFLLLAPLQAPIVEKRLERPHEIFPCRDDAFHTWPNMRGVKHQRGVEPPSRGVQAGSRSLDGGDQPVECLLLLVERSSRLWAKREAARRPAARAGVSRRR